MEKIKCTRLEELNHSQLQQVYFQFFNHCTSCINMIEFVPKKALIRLIKNDISKKNLKTHFETFIYNKDL